MIQMCKGYWGPSVCGYSGFEASAAEPLSFLSEVQSFVESRGDFWIALGAAAFNVTADIPYNESIGEIIT